MICTINNPLRTVLSKCLFFAEAPLHGLKQATRMRLFLKSCSVPESSSFNCWAACRKVQENTTLRRTHHMEVDGNPLAGKHSSKGAAIHFRELECISVARGIATRSKDATITTRSTSNKKLLVASSSNNSGASRLTAASRSAQKRRKRAWAIKSADARTEEGASQSVGLKSNSRRN